MANDYSIDTVRQLEKTFADCQLKRPMRVARYEDGTQLSYSLEFIEPSQPAQVRLQVERFVGGGYAGQVYRVKVLSLTQDGKPVESCATLSVGNTYAIKILVPPSGMGCLFRNFLYAVGFQGMFQLQVNPAAAKAGALWQKFIQQAAAARFNDKMAVNTVHAILVDTTLGSCGEISDWVEGRTWRLEVDDHMDILKLWRKKRLSEHENLGSPEYRAKYQFMHDFVKLLHEMGAHEFARQYEWTTCKSQPNALKQLSTGDDPKTGLTAVDFRAGLTLLPFLPMSPGDFKLIGQGILRGSLVQFDRGDINTLEQFITEHPQIFSSMPNSTPMLEKLKECETIYRNSVPDITHNHIRLLTDGNLWQTIFQGSLQGWKIRGLIDEPAEKTLGASKIKFAVFWLLGLIPLLGRFTRKLWGRADYRAHYTHILCHGGYFLKALRGHIIEALIGGYRAGRFNAAMVEFITQHPIWYFAHLPLLMLPAGLHRFLTDWEVFRSKIYDIFVWPFKLYFNASLRSEWLREMVATGQKKHILSSDDAKIILAQIEEPYIQKYLVSLVVHLMTIFVSETCWLIVTLYYWKTHPDVSWTELGKMSGVILVAFNVLPISPGSIVRGIYTSVLAIRERNFKDYNIALFLSFFKIVGYLAFPIQMAYRYPALARFMASHWATDAVHSVPVFGERGALLERWVFGLCYNWPLTIRRRMISIAETRKSQTPNYLHLPVVIGLTWSLLISFHQIYHQKTAVIPAGENLWYLSKFWPFAGPILCGWFVTVFAGGMPLIRRIISAAGCGAVVAIAYSVGAFFLEKTWFPEQQTALFQPLFWRTFAFIILSTFSVIIRELLVQDPDWKYLQATG
jgi:hypothetical protein